MDVASIRNINAGMTDSSFENCFKTFNPSSAISYAGFACKFFSLPATCSQGTVSWDGRIGVLRCFLCMRWRLLRLNRHLIFRRWTSNTFQNRSSLNDSEAAQSRAVPVLKKMGIEVQHFLQESFVSEVATAACRKMRHWKLWPLAASHWCVTLVSAGAISEVLIGREIQKDGKALDGNWVKHFN